MRGGASPLSMCTPPGIVIRELENNKMLASCRRDSQVQIIRHDKLIDSSITKGVKSDTLCIEKGNIEMARYLLLAFIDCKDPAREEEFNDWYDNVHLPDMLEVEGLVKATRWMTAENAEGQQRRYLALYEVETEDDIETLNEKIKRKGMWTMEAGRFSDLPVFDPPNIPRVYKQIMEEKQSK